ncbi:MAG: S28 family serine protease [Lutibacter sp.]
MKKYKLSIFLLIIGISFSSCRVNLQPVQILTLKQKLEQIFPNAEITAMEKTDFYTKKFQIILNEPFDHQHPYLGTFKHYIYLSHVSYKSPNVIVTEGYNANPRTYELSKILRANQIQVEYRFYGKSRPDSIPWKYLKNGQAVEDYHQLVTKLKTLYTGKWISTGISKGGETVLIYKSKYPYDVNVAVPYVAPLINGTEDKRTENLYNSVGSDTCRLKIKNFQRTVLKNRKNIITEINKYAKKRGMEFTEVPVEEALEYAVLELPFSFWQWGGKCDEIPNDNATAFTQFNFINKIVGIGYYSNKTYYDLLPSFYQHETELGYYGFDTSPVKDLLQVVKQPTNKRFAPKNIDLTYDLNYIKKVRDYVENQGNKILYIYGSFDPWGACAPNPKPHVNYLKMVLKGGSHKTRIKSFSKLDQQKIYDTLQKWLGYSVTIYPLK